MLAVLPKTCESTGVDRIVTKERARMTLTDMF